MVIIYWQKYLVSSNNIGSNEYSKCLTCKIVVISIIEKLFLGDNLTFQKLPIVSS